MVLSQDRKEALARLQKHADWAVFLNILRQRHGDLQHRLIMMDGTNVDVLRGQLRELTHWDLIFTSAHNVNRSGP